MKDTTSEFTALPAVIIGRKIFPFLFTFKDKILPGENGCYVHLFRSVYLLLFNSVVQENQFHTIHFSLNLPGRVVFSYYRLLNLSRLGCIKTGSILP